MLGIANRVRLSVVFPDRERSPECMVVSWLPNLSMSR